MTEDLNTLREALEQASRINPFGDVANANSKMAAAKALAALSRLEAAADHIVDANKKVAEAVPVGEVKPVALEPLDLNSFAEICHDAHIDFELSKFPSYERAIEHRYLERLRLITTPPAPIEGWKLVPVEPTDDMLAAFADATSGAMVWDSATEDDRQSVRDGFTPGYRAMLAAAPSSGIEGWKPIETAPKDGSLFLCWVSAVSYGETDEGQQYQVDISQPDFAQWQAFEEAPEGGWFEPCCGQISDHMEVTHWMPLPAAPQPGDKA